METNEKTEQPAKKPERIDAIAPEILFNAKSMMGMFDGQQGAALSSNKIQENIRKEINNLLGFIPE